MQKTDIDTTTLNGNYTGSNRSDRENWLCLHGNQFALSAKADGIPESEMTVDHYANALHEFLTGEREVVGWIGTTPCFGARVTLPMVVASTKRNDAAVPLTPEQEEETARIARHYTLREREVAILEEHFANVMRYWRFHDEASRLHEIRRSNPTGREQMAVRSILDRLRDQGRETGIDTVWNEKFASLYARLYNHIMGGALFGERDQSEFTKIDIAMIAAKTQELRKG